MATTSAAMNAIALLKADHRAVEALFEKYESTNGAKAKEKIARQICAECRVRARNFRGHC